MAKGAAEKSLDFPHGLLIRERCGAAVFPFIRVRAGSLQRALALLKLLLTISELQAGRSVHQGAIHVDHDARRAVSFVLLAKSLEDAIRRLTRN